MKCTVTKQRQGLSALIVFNRLYLLYRIFILKIYFLRLVLHLYLYLEFGNLFSEFQKIHD